MKQSLKSGLLHALTAAMLVVIPMHQAHSAPGTLPTSPLYLSTIVEPNVFLTLDDSGSMQSEYTVPLELDGLLGKIIIDDGSLVEVGIAWVDSYYRLSLHPAVSNTVVIPPAAGPVGSVVLPEAWVFRSHKVNTTYYNPYLKYEPWPGTDAAGNPLYPYITVADINSVPFFARSWSSFVSLIGPYKYFDGVYSSTDYYIPTYYETDDTINNGDTNNNGVIDAGDDHTLYEIRPVADGGPATYPSGRGYTGEIENFANWWVYHRSREHLTKATIGKIINNSDSNRMGLRVFNGGHVIDAATMSDPANKLALLKAFYAVPSSGITPARTALDEVGQMFAGTSAVPTPILPSSDGGSCQQNFNILTSDSYWNGPPPTWGTKPPKDTKNTDVSTATDPSIFDGDASQSNDGGNYADSYTDTLADVAMHYYETDLSAFIDEVPARKGVDEATHQHLVNHTLSFGLEGSLDPTIEPTSTDPPFAGWPDPLAAGINKIDDLSHAGYNSRGSNLFAADAAELESALSLTLSSISEITGTTTASVAVNSAKLSTSSVVYLATFYSGFWNGDLAAFPIIDLNTGELADTPDWQAASILTARDPAGKPRNIITFDAATDTGIPFKWADLTTAMLADLNTGPGGVADALGESRLDYIRGDRSNEVIGLGFRERASLLGDTINSSPVFVGPPNLRWPDGGEFPAGTEAYSVFKTTYKDREGLLYVGANDGMLHAFDDIKGEEKFAYVPGLVYSSGVANQGLHYLTDPNYIHNYYVDLTPTVSDVYFSTGNWHTVLIGGLRGGGRGFFALDVTNPKAFGDTTTKADEMSLWEFTSTDDADLGYTFSRPTIGLSNAGTWVAIFGNGYNSTGSGEASLFIVNIEKGLDGSWAQVGDYEKIVLTGHGTPGDQNGLSTPSLADLDGNGTIDRAYAGDLRGNMWAFDLSATTPNSWDVAFKSGSTPQPLFTTPANQPITAKPVLASHPTQPDSNQTFPNVMVYFGTGQYLVSGDKVTTDVQSFYGVWDNQADNLTQLNLIEQTFDSSFTGRVLTRNPVDYPTDQGCFFNLTDSGERSVTSPIARNDTVFFNTFVPSDQACDRGGYGYRFAVDMATCGSPLVPTIDSNDDGVVDDNDYQSNGVDQSTLAAVRQEGFLPEPVFIEDLAFTGDTASKIKSLSNIPAGRFSWIELLF